MFKKARAVSLIGLLLCSVGCEWVDNSLRGRVGGFHHLLVELGGLPENPSKDSDLDVTVGGAGITHYKYKLGLDVADGPSFCANPSGYSVPDHPLVHNISDSLSSGEGQYTLCVVGGDGAGHWQGWDHAIFYSWVHDTSPPTGVSLEINNGDGYTRQAQVTLTLAAMEAAEMCLKRGADCTNCSSWEPVAASRPWSLQPAEEETIATVSAQFRDEAGNLSVCVSSSIHHDSLPPNNPSNLSLGAVPASLSQTPTFTFTDEGDQGAGGSGIEKFQVQIHKEDDDSLVEPWQDIESGNSVSADLAEASSYYAVIKAIDKAGNESSGILSVPWVAIPPPPEILLVAQTVSGSREVKLPLNGTVTNISVDWGDGQSDGPFNGAVVAEHTYGANGTWEIKISGDKLSHFGAGGSINTFDINMTRITEVKSFGNLGLESLENAFYGAENLVSVSADLPPGVTNLRAMFSYASNFNDPNIGSWDTRHVTDMSRMFFSATSFNQDIGSWDTSKVTDMSRMFGTFIVSSPFNQDISNWDTGNVTNMSGMFELAYKFNQNLSAWDTSKVTDMSGMFSHAEDFNQNIGGWDTSKVTNMSGMFWAATTFNQDLSSWCVTHIPNSPNQFDSGATSWLLPGSRPVWGTCPGGP